MTPAVGLLCAGDLAHGVMEGQAEHLDMEVNGVAGQIAFGPTPVAVFDFGIVSFTNHGGCFRAVKTPPPSVASGGRDDWCAFTVFVAPAPARVLLVTQRDEPLGFCPVCGQKRHARDAFQDRNCVFGR